MTAKNETEVDGKQARSYSLASAPLRLLSHSFHSTANSHSTTSTGNSSPLVPSSQDSSFSIDCDHATVLKETIKANVPSPTQAQTQGRDFSRATRKRPTRKAMRLASHRLAVEVGSSHESNTHHVLDQSSASMATANGNARTSSLVSARQTLDQDRLEMLLMPYDIRHSIFGQLSLQEIYNCQLTSRLLYWATSDQAIWKRIALNLIQGEFYFDIPRTLPANIPNWKYFCKRHLLRQRNWRRGQVQEIITLDDDYQKLTTLQIMAPYVLTGCDDGRIHLWNINTRTLLHRFQIRGEITWVEHLQEAKIVAGLGYDIEAMRSEIRLFSTETGEQLGLYEEDFWDLAICAINETYLVASDGEGRYTAWNWKTGVKVSQFKVEDESSITEALYLVQNTILELHYDGLIRLFSISGECFGRFTLDSILPDNKVSFCWLHNDFSMVVWESSNTMAHIRLPLLQNKDPGHTLARPISQEEWDSQGAEIYWRHQLTHTCNFAAMGGGRFQLLYVQIFDNLTDQVPIRVHSLRHSGTAASTIASPMVSPTPSASSSPFFPSLPSPFVGSPGGGGGGGGEFSTDAKNAVEQIQVDDEAYGWQHGEYVTAHSLNPELEKIIQGLRPSRIDCDPEYIVVGLVQGGVRLLQFAPVDDVLMERAPSPGASGGLGARGQGD